METLFSLLCLTSIAILAFIYNLLKLPIVANLIYLRVGSTVAGEVIEDIAKAVVAVKEPNAEVAQAIVTVLHQYNLLPEATEATELTEVTEE